MVESLTSLHGRQLGLDQFGALVGNGLQITSPCADASITVQVETSDARVINIQLKDIKGNDLTSRAVVFAFMSNDANGDAFSTTGGSTGIAASTDGAVLALVAKKAFILISEDDGDIDLTWTDTGTNAAYLHLILPNGRRVVSSLIQNA